MTDVEKARDSVYDAVVGPIEAIEAIEMLIEAKAREIAREEVSAYAKAVVAAGGRDPYAETVPEPVKRMMRARGYDGMSYATTINTLAHHYDTEHEESEWCCKLGCKPVEERAKRMMLANTKKRGWPHGSDHAENSACEMGPPDVRCQPCEAEPETPAKKRTVSEEARKKIVYALWGYALWGVTVDESAAEERADRIIAIIEADGAEASA